MLFTFNITLISGDEGVPDGNKISSEPSVDGLTNIQLPSCPILPLALS